MSAAFPESVRAEEGSEPRLPCWRGGVSFEADLHYIPPALPPVHSEDVTLSLAKIRTHPNGKGH